MWFVCFFIDREKTLNRTKKCQKLQSKWIKCGKKRCNCTKPIELKTGKTTWRKCSFLNIIFRIKTGLKRKTLQSLRPQQYNTVSQRLNIYQTTYTSQILFIWLCMNNRPRTQKQQSFKKRMIRLKKLTNCISWQTTNSNYIT
jgi:hypothetical protein